MSILSHDLEQTETSNLVCRRLDICEQLYNHKIGHEHINQTSGRSSKYLIVINFPKNAHRELRFPKLYKGVQVL